MIIMLKSIGPERLSNKKNLRDDSWIFLGNRNRTEEGQVGGGVGREN